MTERPSLLAELSSRDRWRGWRDVDPVPHAYLDTMMFRAALVLTLVAFLLKVVLIATGALELGIEGDEGARILAASQNSGSLADAFKFFVMKWSNIHPPGDIALRAAYFSLVYPLFPGLDPVSAAMYFSAALGSIGALLLTDAARRIGGGLTALIFAVLLAFTWGFHNPSLSGMGEGTVIPFFALQIWLLVKGIVERSHATLLLSAVTTLVASLMRPEPVFLLPGICLGVWYAAGLATATAYGAIASSYSIAKNIVPTLINPSAITIFNFAENYAFKGIEVSKFHTTGVGRGLLSDPFPMAIFVIIALAVTGLVPVMRTWNAREPQERTTGDLANMVIFLAAVLYLAVTITSVITGRTANASVRLGYLPQYLLLMCAAYGVARLLRTGAAGAISRFDLALLTGAPRFRWQVLAGAIALLLVTTALQAREFAVLGTKRGPQNALKVRDWLLANTSPNDGFFLDRSFYRDNWIVGYLARRPDVCVYFACRAPAPPKPDPKTATPYCGQLGRLCAYKPMHTFIRVKRPRWFFTHTGKLSKIWLENQKGFFGQEHGERGWSLLLQYSQPLAAADTAKASTPINDTKPDPFPEAAIVPRRVTTYDGFSFVLTPRFSNGSFVIYEAKY